MQREREKIRKEQEKASQLEAAKREVDEFEGGIAALLSLHKVCADPIDWFGLASALPPSEPPRVASLQARLWRAQRVASPTDPPTPHPRILLEQAVGAASAEFEADSKSWSERRSLARKILSGDSHAYAKALETFSLVMSCSSFHPEVQFSVRSPRLLQADILVSDSEVVPPHTKSLTSTGKVSVKPMPRARANELFQDYVCSAMIRVARESFAILPIENLLLTARAPIFNSATGKDESLPVYSAAISRERLQPLDFERLDPSDALESFPHRGDFKASRKAGAFQPINPFAASDVAPQQRTDLGLPALRAHANQLREEIEQAFALRSSLDVEPEDPI